MLDPKVYKTAGCGDALAELDVELGLAEWRGKLVLDDLHTHPIADRLGAVLERLDAPDVEALGGIELQRAPTRLSLGEPNMTPTFSRIWLVRMQSVCVRFRLPASLRIAWDIIRACAPTVWSPIWPLELDARGERGDRVDRDDVDGAGAHEHVGDLQRLLAVVGLGDEQLVDVDADLLRVEGIHRVLGVDERAHSAQLLRLGEYVVDHRGLARGLRAEHLDDAPPGHTADPERQVERERARGDRVAAHLRALVAHAHDRALAELALDLRERALKGGVTRALAAFSWSVTGMV